MEVDLSLDSITQVLENKRRNNEFTIAKKGGEGDMIYSNLRLSRFAAVKNLNIGKDIWISNQTLPFILSHFSSSRSRDYPHHMLNRHLSTGGRHFYLLAQILQPTSQSKREVQVRRLK